MVIHQFNRIIKNKWIWGVFAVAISFFFAFDFLLTDRHNDRVSGSAAGKLGDEEIAMKDFSTYVSDVRGFGRGRDTRTPASEVNLKAWQNAAAFKVAKAANLEATDADVKAAISRDPSFRGENGAFSMRVYEMLLRDNGLTPEMFQSYLKRRLTLNKLTQVVLGSASWVSPMELEGAINDVTDKFTVRVAAFEDKAADKVTLDDKMLEAYYKDNTNSIALPECVTVKYVKFPADTPARLAQFKISDDELHDHYDATSRRFETVGTNGVAVTKKFEEVKPILMKELQVLASVEAYRTNLLARVYPDDPKLAADNKVDRLVKIAAEEKAKVETSKPFAIDGRGFVKGFMTRASVIAPGCEGFAAAVAELDPETADLRYGVVAGTNCVYLVERDQTIKAHVPAFADAKEHIRADALADAQAKAFKATVEKSRALAAAELAKGKAFDPAMLAGATVTTSIVFSVSTLQHNSFQDSMYVSQGAMKLAKGQLSDFIKTHNPRRGLVVYVEKRENGDAAQAQIVRAQLRDELSRGAVMSLSSGWQQWNLDRIGFTANASASTKASDDDSDLAD